jgi:outer membrane protein assembly factor BamB
MPVRSACLTMTLFITFSVSIQSQIIPERQWPSYRGYMSSGVLDNANLPDSFNIATMYNVKWKIGLPGLGLSSPVIWGDRLFVTTAVSKSDNQGIKPGIYGDGNPVPDSSVHDWKVFCIDKNSGKVLWEKTSYTGIPKIRRHPKSTHANTSMATNGKYAVAFFGSEGLYCYDYVGKLIWSKNFGTLKSVAFNSPDAEWEFASSPVIYNGVVIIQCDVLENSFLAAYDVKTGKEIWKIKRDEYPGWCTPNIYISNGKPVIAVNGFKHRGGYDFLTGKEIWRMSGGGDVPIPTPVIGNGLIYFNSAHGKSSPVIAVKTEATGDLTLKEGETFNEFVKWSLPRGGAYMHSLLLYQGRLYNANWNGTVNCLDPLTGKEIYNAKVGKTKSFVASVVAADGKLYYVDEDGNVFILQAGDTFKQLASIPLNDICLTAPAITDGMIFFRTQKSLIAVGKK